MAVCFLANAGYTGGFSPGRTFGPVVCGPVRGAEGVALLTALVGTWRGVGVGVGVLVPSALPLVHAASIPAITPNARNRKRIGKSWQVGSLSGQ